jgi:NAD(P)-dependent dehydrogenase (short-subunit alcohol dehydrogenase family)
MFDLKGRVALVTGGSRGLGLQMAAALGRAGCRLVITARKEVELHEALARLQSEGLEATSYQNDLSDLNSFDALVNRIADSCGNLDILVNNAGATWGGPAEGLAMQNWLKVINVNLNGTWALTQAVARRFMIPRRKGSIIFVASVQGLGGVAPGGTPTVAYNTTKAAQINLARTLAAEWGPHNVRVNALLPGWLPTKMTHATLEAEGSRLLTRIPLGRLGDPDRDLGGPIVFLASDAARYVTGQALAVDGGLSSVI